MADDVRIVMDNAKLAEVLRGPQGPVMRRLIIDGEDVKREAKRLVGVYRPPDAYSAQHRTRRPGTLRDSIVKRVVTGTPLPRVEVGSDDPIALIHHEGTQPHVIRPRNAKLLVFYWPKAGRVVYREKVNHPGTRPNRFLTNALRILRGRYR